MNILVAIKQEDLIKQVFNEQAYKKLHSVGEVTFIHNDLEYNIDKFEEIISDYDFCITGWGSFKFTPEILSKAKKLKLIGHTAGTIVPIVDRSAFERGIKIVNANRYLAKSTAELAVMLMLAGAWNLNGYNLNMKKSIWSDGISESVMGVGQQVIGLVGYGEIAKEVIRLLKPFNAEILLWSNYCSKEEAKQLGVELCDLDTLLSSSQIVSLHNTLTRESVGMIGKRELALMRDGALFVNTARQQITDNESLIAELKSGRIFGAIDVYEEEPIPASHPLLQLPNVICSPHIGGFANPWKSKFAELIADNIIAYVNGKELLSEVSVELYDRQSPM